MKIALIIASLTIKGGGQRQILQLGENLQKRGWEVTIFTADLNQEKCYPDLCKKLLIRSLSKGKKRRTNQSSRFPFKSQITDLLNILKIAYMVYKYEPDILNPHEWPANWIACLAKLLRKGRVKIVWMCNDLWHVYNLYEQMAPSVLARIRRIADILLTKNLIDQVVVLDYRIKALVKKIYGREAAVVRSGLDIKKFASFKLSRSQKNSIRHNLGINDNDFFLLSVGIFFPQRRYEDVVLALERIRNKYGALFEFKYVIVGANSADFAYFQYIQSLIKKHKLEKIIKLVVNPVTDDELLSYYSACDLFIFPNDKQTWGLAVIEAMALGKPCIVSKGAGVHEVLTNGKNALLIKPRNPSDLAEKLIKLLSKEDLRKQVGKIAKDFVFSTFSWEKYTCKMREIFRKARND